MATFVLLLLQLVHMYGVQILTALRLFVRRFIMEITEEQRQLARKALKEFWDNGRDNSKITVVCPKCGKSPTVTITPKGERTTCLCECKYIISCEINFCPPF